MAEHKVTGHAIMTHSRNMFICPEQRFKKKLFRALFRSAERELYRKSPTAGNREFDLSTHLMLLHYPEMQKYSGLHDDRLRTVELDLGSPLLLSVVNHNPQIPAQTLYN
jgi:hypothetical protein